MLIATNAVSNLIRERKTFQLFSLMQTGMAHGVQTLNAALIALVKQRVIDADEAYSVAVNKSEMKTLLGRR